MDAGLYNLSSDQASISAAMTLISLATTKRSCTGWSLSGGVFTVSAGTYLVLGNFDFDKTAGTSAFTYTAMAVDPGGTPEIYGGSVPALHPVTDSVSGLAGTSGPAMTFIQTAQNLTIGPVAIPGGSNTFTCDSTWSWICPIQIDGPLVSSGIYTRATDQTGINAVAAQIVWNNTVVACTGVSLSSGAFTFTSDGIYVVIGTPAVARTAGAGKDIAFQWTTDSTSTGTSAYSVGMPSRQLTMDALNATGSNAGHIAVVNRSGSDVTIGSNVKSMTGATTYTVQSLYSHVLVWRLT